MSFGITQETRSEGTKLFNPPIKLEQPTTQFPNKYKFPTGRLVNVIVNKEFDTKNGKTTVLQFIFKGSKGEVHTHTEWKQDPSEDSYNDNIAKMNSRIKHILEQTKLSLPERGIGTDATNFEEFFEAVAATFNGQTVEDKEGKKTKKYYIKRLYLKLTYYKGNLNFPQFPDFIQTAEDNDGKPKVCDLTINHKYDNIEPDSGGGSNPFNNVGGASGSDDLPDFS